MSKLDEGWGFPMRARKAHFYVVGSSISLCGGWMFTGPREPRNSPASPDDCLACTKKLRLVDEAAEIGLGFTAWGKVIKPYFGRTHYDDPKFANSKPLMHAFARRGERGIEGGGAFAVIAKCGYKADDFGGGLRWVKRKPKKIDYCTNCARAEETE